MMKKIFLVLFMLLSLTTPVFADDVELIETIVDSTIHQDGTATIRETWNIDFDGMFTQYERSIPLVSDERISDIHVYVDGVESQPLSTRDDRRPNGYYYAYQGSDELVLYIYMKANYTHKSFTIEYTTNKATMCYSDVLEFNRFMVGDEWDYDIGKVSGTISFPQVADMNNDIYVWGHGPANGVVNIQSNHSVYYECNDYPNNTALSIRLLLPSQLFNMEKINKDYLSQILNEEATFAKKEAAIQKWKKIKIYGSASLGGIVGLGSVIYLWIKKRRISKAIKPSLEVDYYRDLPSDLSPSEVIDLMNYIGHDFDEKNKFASTLMSLSLKGLIDFEEYEEDGFFGNKKKTKLLMKRNQEAYNQLKPHEQILYNFIESAGNQQETTFDDIEKYTQVSPVHCKERLDTFRQTSHGLIEKAGYLDLKVKTGHLLLISFALIIVGAIAIPFLPLFGIPVAISGVISLVLSGTTKRYTQKGADEVALWEAFERFLKEFTLMNEKELPELVVWEEYLIYATAMGIGEKVLKQLPEKYPQFYESTVYTHSYVRHFYYHRQPNVDLLDRFNDFSSQLNTAMHYSENSSGKGGNFSGGGSGSFGGGGRIGGGGGGRFS